MTILRIENKGVPLSQSWRPVGRVNCYFFFDQSNTDTNSLSDFDQIDEKKFLSIQKAHFFKCVLQDTVGGKGLRS